MTTRIVSRCAVWAFIATLTPVLAAAESAHVAFDLPSTIECRDVTTPEFAAAHPAQKMIEARLQISARILQGTEQEIVSFRYFISSPDKMLRFREYSPNTTLESTVADDRIEISEGTETSDSTGADAHVAEHVLALGGSKSSSNKSTKTTKYKQIAPRSLVVASGTTDREHGLFFTLKPSNAGSLEGAKEFTFRAAVPRTWRGDWCTISCSARGEKKSVFSTTELPAGSDQADVGLYLLGDEEAAALSRELCRALDAHEQAVAAQASSSRDPFDRVFGAVSNEYKSVLGSIFRSKSDETAETNEANPVEEASEAVWDVKERLRALAR